MNTFGHIILVTQFTPDPAGHGGNHRAYQIFQDLEKYVESQKISYISLDSQAKSMNDWRKKKPQSPEMPVSRLKLLIKERLPFLRAAHPIEKLMGKWFMFNRFSPPEFSKYYAGQIDKLPQPLLCVIENAAFGPALLPVNKKRGIPTLVCPQNLESWDRLLPVTTDDHRQNYLACLDFADEWQIFEQCDMTLFISKLEHALFTSLGLPSLYYPYRPVGEVEKYWQGIRKSRSETKPRIGSFLMLGSCSHRVTRYAFETLLQALATQNCLPAIQLIVAGNLSETLTVPPSLSKHVELRGRISQTELAAELTSTTAMIVPHEIGFGSLTRLSELSCGGVPVLASAFASYSMDPPPGIQWIDTGSENAWFKSIAQALENPPSPATSAEYEVWHSRQKDPWREVISKVHAMKR